MGQRSKTKREIDEALNHQKYREIDAERDRLAGRVPQAPPKPLFVDGERAYSVPAQKTQTSMQRLETANKILAECERIDREKAARDKAKDEAAFDPRGGLSPEAYAALSGRGKLELANRAEAAKRAAGQ